MAGMEMRMGMGITNSAMVAERNISNQEKQVIECLANLLLNVQIVRK